MLFCRHQIPSCQLVIEIPSEFESAAKYRGTLGHKVNHSFKPNSLYEMIDSPRQNIYTFLDTTTILIMALLIMTLLITLNTGDIAYNDINKCNITCGFFYLVL
jgi:hypothetical protein